MNEWMNELVNEGIYKITEIPGTFLALEMEDFLWEAQQECR